MMSKRDKNLKYDEYYVGYDVATKKCTLILEDDPQLGITVKPTNTVELQDIMIAIDELLQNEESYPEYIAISTMLYDNLPNVSVKIAIPNY